MTRSHSNLLFQICIATLAIHSIAAAQNPGYRTELSNGTNGWMIVINLSDQPIEALTEEDWCSGRRLAGFTFDALQNPFRTNATHPFGQALHPPLILGEKNGAFMQNDVILPGEHWYSLAYLNSQPDGCALQAKINAVLYSNGTYGGDEHSARALQLYRDGIAVAVRYWAETLRADDDNLPALQTIATDAEQRSAKDRDKGDHPSCFIDPQPIACSYWQGRNQVDSNFSVHWNNELKLDNDPQGAFHRTIDFIENWRDKIDSNVALHKLDETFPLPPDLADTSQPPNLSHGTN